jgi:colicin import membrane protein
MFGALPPYAAPPGRPVTEAAASAPGDTGLQPDGDAGNEARELAARQLRAAEEQRALQRKAEAERLVQAKEDEQRANRETAETEGRLAVTAGAYAQRVVEDYTHRVSSAIGEKFAIPPSAPTEARAEIEFRVLPDGQVAAVRFVQKSGLTAFDRAIEQAIERARPLPVPPDPGIYLQFRDQRLVFTGAR